MLRREYMSAMTTCRRILRSRSPARLPERSAYGPLTPGRSGAEACTKTAFTMYKRPPTTLQSPPVARDSAFRELPTRQFPQERPAGSRNSRPEVLWPGFSLRVARPRERNSHPLLSHLFASHARRPKTRHRQPVPASRDRDLRRVRRSGRYPTSRGGRSSPEPVRPPLTTRSNPYDHLISYDGPRVDAGSRLARRCEWQHGERRPARWVWKMRSGSPRTDCVPPWMLPSTSTSCSGCCS